MAFFTQFKFIFVALIFGSSLSAIAEEKSDLPNFAEVTPNLYRGGEPTGDGLVQLKKMGVRTIINLQGGDLRTIPASLLKKTEPGEFPDAITAEGNAADALQIQYRNYPLDSFGSVNEDEQNEIAQILKDIADPDLQPLYIHCQHGVDRTGLIIALERVQFEGWSKDAAHAEWKRLGHDDVRIVLMYGLDRYFESFQPQ